MRGGVITRSALVAGSAPRGPRQDACYRFLNSGRRPYATAFVAFREAWTIGYVEGEHNYDFRWRWQIKGCGLATDWLDGRCPSSSRPAVTGSNYAKTLHKYSIVFASAAIRSNSGSCELNPAWRNANRGNSLTAT